MTITAGRPFRLRSVDVYSSTTPIPWTFTGLVGSATAFTASGQQGSTYGAFATVANPNAATTVDTLRIRIANPAFPCCRNPSGIDNIVIDF